MILALLAFLCASVAGVVVISEIASARKRHWQRRLAEHVRRLELPSLNMPVAAWEDGWNTGFHRALTMIGEGWSVGDLRTWIEEERS